jgi:hypothetical protein
MASPERGKEDRAGIAGPISIFSERHPRPSVVASGQNSASVQNLIYIFFFFFLVAMIILLYASAGRQDVLARSHTMKARK